MVKKWHRDHGPEGEKKDEVLVHYAWRGEYKSPGDYISVVEYEDGTYEVHRSPSGSRDIITVYPEEGEENITNKQEAYELAVDLQRELNEKRGVN
jgi:hypothetical protein